MPTFLRREILSSRLVRYGSSFSGEITEVEQIAEKIGQYGNVLGYKIENKEGYSNIIYIVK